MKLKFKILLGVLLALLILVLGLFASSMANEFIKLFQELGASSLILESARYWWLFSAIPLSGTYLEITKKSKLSNKFYIAAIVLIPLLLVLFLWGAYSPMFNMEGSL